MSIHFRDPENLLRFSDELDPARFANCPETEAKTRCVRASASMMLGLLYGIRVPVLSQNQVFDSRHILEVAGSTGVDKRQAEERSGFLSLIRSSYIQMRIHPIGLVPLPGGKDPFTLSNALASSLMQPTFVFSAWPDMPHEERVELARILRGESRAAWSPRLGRHVEAVLAMNEAFVASGASERAETIDTSLETFVDTQVAYRAQHGLDYLQETLAALKALAEQAATAPRALRAADGSKVAPFDLNKRSDWRRLIATYSSATPHRRESDDESLQAVSTVVDIAYNRKVGLSLGARFQRETAETDDDPRMMLSDPGLVSAHAETTALVEDTSLQWLGWRDVWEFVDGHKVPAQSTREWQLELLNELLTMKVAATVDAGGVLRVLHYVRAGLTPVMPALRVAAVAAPIAGAGIGAVVADPLLAMAVAGVGTLPEVARLALETGEVRKLLIARGLRAARASLAAELRTA